LPRDVVESWKENQQDTAGQVTRQDQEGPNRTRQDQAGLSRTRQQDQELPKRKHQTGTGSTNRNTGNFERKISVFEKHLQSEPIVFVIL
jgi:hypothetical protein